ncbi:MAG: ParB/RepB/Spo0J family partition protein [Clostridia bacterium]|nr:ParB/RepB/Spo0J family partition protein [Clostridia bacterium]
MADKKRGLGRGLDALLDPYSAAPDAPRAGVLSVSVRAIDTNALQPRTQFDGEALKELSDSIRVHGIVQPLIVKEKNGRYMIIAGERRFRAARMAGLDEVPVIVADYDEERIHEVSLIENIQREDLNPIEEAAAIRFLMQQHDMTQEEVSSRIGKSRPAVANALRLLNLPAEVIDMLRDGRITAGHGRALAGLSDQALIKSLAEETLRLGYSVRALESRIKNLHAKKPGKKTAPALSASLTNLEDSLRERLGTKVRLQGTEKRGRITIEYYTREDLERIYDCVLKRDQ